MSVLIFLFVGLATVDSVALGSGIDLPASTKAVVSTDSPYTPTSTDKHNYRYRAVFVQNVHQEVPGALRIEKVQLPDAKGSPYTIAWTHTVDLSTIKTVAAKYKELPFESALGCCDYSDLRWEKYRLKFKVSLAVKNFSCVSTDVTKGEPTIECN